MLKCNKLILIFLIGILIGYSISYIPSLYSIKIIKDVRITNPASW